MYTGGKLLSSMRAYGKRNGLVAIYNAHLDKSEEAKLSDDSEIEDGADSDARSSQDGDQSMLLSDSIEPNRSIKSLSVDTVATANGTFAVKNSSAINDQSQDNSVSMAISSSFDKAAGSSELNIFDFLDENDRFKKRRRINYKKKPLDDNGEPQEQRTPKNPLNETINDVNQLLSSLQNVNDGSIEKSFQKKLEQSVREKDAAQDKVTYGRARTMLQSKEDEPPTDEEEEEGDEKNQTRKIHETEDQVTTHHFNDLKNMGDFLKYQDDLDFLTEDSSIIIDSKILISKLLNLALAVINDEGFLQYITKNNLSRTVRWCFSRVSADPFVLLLQGYLVTKLELTFSDLPSSIQKSLLLMLPQTIVPDNTSIQNKMTRLNFMDFLEQTSYKTAQTYALELYLKYPAQLSSSQFAYKVFTLAGQERNAQLIFQCIETLLTTETNNSIAQNMDEAVLLIRKLVQQLSKYENNEHIIKSMILLTNDSSILSMLSLKEETLIYTQSIEFVLMKISSISRDSADILILYLGLALNVITQFENLVPVEPQWIRSHDVLLKLEQNDLDECNRFAINMFCLNFAYMTSRLKKTISDQERFFLATILDKFDKQSGKYNEKFHEKINDALNKLL